jgi:hypothetical protein
MPLFAVCSGDGGGGGVEEPQQPYGPLGPPPILTVPSVPPGVVAGDINKLWGLTGGVTAPLNPNCAGGPYCSKFIAAAQQLINTRDHFCSDLGEMAMTAMDQGRIEFRNTDLALAKTEPPVLFGKDTHLFSQQFVHRTTVDSVANIVAHEMFHTVRPFASDTEAIYHNLIGKDVWYRVGATCGAR